MRDEIAKIIEKETSEWDNAYWVCADGILSLLKEEIEKSLLSDVEILKASEVATFDDTGKLRCWRY